MRVRARVRVRVRVARVGADGVHLERVGDALLVDREARLELAHLGLPLAQLGPLEPQGALAARLLGPPLALGLELVHLVELGLG